MNEQLVDILLTHTTVLVVYPPRYCCLCLLCLVCTGAAVPLDLIRCSRMHWSEDLQVFYLPSGSNSTISSVALWEVNRNNNNNKRENYSCVAIPLHVGLQGTEFYFCLGELLGEYIQYTMQTIIITILQY